MSRTRLTDARVRALRPAKSARDVRDTDLAGFGVRVLPGGGKRFFTHFQHEGRRTWRILGDPDGMTVAEARERARNMLAAVRTGRPAPDGETPFEAVAEAAFRRHGRNWKPSTLSRNRHHLRRQILPRFGGRQIAAIMRKDVRDWFASMHATPVAADRSMPVLSVIMKYAEAEGLRPEGSNPCRGIRRYRRKNRERFLSEAEFGRLGRALREVRPSPAVPIIRLLALTGCRPGEIRTLRWTDFRDGHVYLRDGKTGPRTVWLSSAAREVLDGLPRPSPCRPGPADFTFRALRAMPFLHLFPHLFPHFLPAWHECVRTATARCGFMPLIDKQHSGCHRSAPNDGEPGFYGHLLRRVHWPWTPSSRSCPVSWCVGIRCVGPARSACHVEGQHSIEIVAHGSGPLRCHRSMGGAPLVGLLDKDCARREEITLSLGKVPTILVRPLIVAWGRSKGESSWAAVSGDAPPGRSWRQERRARPRS